MISKWDINFGQEIICYAVRQQIYSGGNIPSSNPKCCGGETQPFYVYNSNVKECCWNGNIAVQGSCPPQPSTTEPPTTEPPTTSPTTTPTTTLPEETTTPPELLTMPGGYGKK